MTDERLVQPTDPPKYKDGSYVGGSVGDSQVKDIKIDLLVQQYEQFTILEEESIDSGFARFNTTITSLKALYEGFSSKNYVRKFLRALHPTWGAKDFAVYKGKKERVKFITLKSKKESSNDETSMSGSKDKEYAMAVRDFKKFFKRKGRFVRQPCGEKKSFRKTDEKKGKGDQKCFRCEDPNHLIGECPKPPRKKTKRRLLGVLGVIAKMKMRKRQMKKLVSWLNRQMRNEILELKEKIKRLERNKAIDIGCESCQELRLENDKLKKSQAKLVNDASKFVKFEQSTNSLLEMLNAQTSPSSKGGIGFNKMKHQQAEQNKLNLSNSKIFW
ncbi:zf-CCHC domain-containing protein [Tanacetum coccineum]